MITLFRTSIILMVLLFSLPVRAEDKPDPPPEVTMVAESAPESQEISDPSDQELIEMLEFIESMELLEEMELLDNLDVLAKE